MSNFLDDVIGIDPGGGGIFDAAGELADYADFIPGIGGIIGGGLRGIDRLGDVYAASQGNAPDVVGDETTGFFDSRTGQLIQAGIGGASDWYAARQQRDAANRSAQLQAEGVQQARGDVTQFGESALSRLAQGAQAQRDIIGQTYDEAGNLISPLANQYQQYSDEQSALLGLSGPQAYQSALSRIADPMAQAQEQAFFRNRAALGGVGPTGNTLAALNEMTRQRTEANIGNRLQQLQSAGSPALQALQQLSSQRIGRGQALSGVEGTAGVTEANALLGQGGQLAQLAQNLGTARAGAPAYQAGTQTPFTQSIQSVLGGIASMPPPIPQVR